MTRLRSGRPPRRPWNLVRALDTHGCHRGRPLPRCLRFSLIAAVMLLGSTTSFAQEKSPGPESDKKDQKLGQRLIRKAVANTDEDVMEGVARLMQEAAHRLEIDFDAGDETQTVQRGILDRLDKAIKVAASRRRPRRQRGRPSSADKRRMARGKPRTADKDKSASVDQAGASPSSTIGARAGAAEGASGGGELRELRRTWGHLPMREREEMIQGIAESFLERYRERIERYYRALQETDE